MTKDSLMYIWLLIAFGAVGLAMAIVVKCSELGVYIHGY